MSGNWGLGAGVEALVSQRSRGQLAYRLGSRLCGVNAALPRDRRTARCVAFAAAAAVDGLTWSWLRRTPSLALPQRLLVDVADVCVFGARAERSPEAAMLIGVPLAAEVGARHGTVGLAVPAAHLAAATAMRRRLGLATPPAAVLPQVQGVALGAAVGAYSRRLRRNARARRTHTDAARVQAATLAGQHELAMSAGALVDRVAGIEYLAAIAGDQPVGQARSLARWKASLAELATSEASYLRVVASRWETARRTNDLGHDVEFDLDAPSGSVVLTRAQADQLNAALDALAPVGRCRLEVVSDETARMPGQPLTVRVDEFALELREDAPTRPALDPAPAMIAAGAGWMLSLSSSGHGQVPRTVTGAGAAASLALAAWSDRALQSPKPPPPQVIVAAAVALATVQALVASRHLRSPVDHDGVQVFPAVLTLMAPGFLAGRYHGALDRSGHIQVAALFGAALAISLIPTRRRVELSHLAAGAGEIAATYLVWSQVQAALARDTERLETELDEVSQASASEAFERGRRQALTLVAEGIDRLAQITAGADSPTEISAEIERRLTAARSELESLRMTSPAQEPGLHQEPPG